MLKNLRVVQTRVLTRDPKILMVAKMKSWPKAPHKQNRTTSLAASGWRMQKEIRSDPLDVKPKRYTA